MKIIYLTDIHDGLRNLKEIILQTTADIYLFSGDIIYKAFFNEEKIIDFCTLQDDLYKISNEKNEDINPYDFSIKILRHPKKYSEEYLRLASTYRNLFHQAAKTMKEKYQLIEEMVKKYANSPAHFLPGNYDIDLQYTALYERDLHRKSIIFNNLKLSGYGGAPIITSGIPEKLSVKFHEYSKNGIQFSEPEDFFRYERPDIVVIHNPAYGFLDVIPSQGHVGSHGIRRYLDDNQPLLVLSGHVHEDQGILKHGNTIFVNPSNFGPVDSIHGIQGGGFFTEITINDNKIENISLGQLNKRNIIKLIDTDCSGNKLNITYINPDFSGNISNFVRI